MASHIWQFVNDGSRATIDATTNSFVPNVVWLPRVLARLSDVQGSRFQAQLIGIAHHLYGGVDFRPRLGRIVETTWQRLPGAGAIATGTIGKLTFFEVNDAWIHRRTKAIEQVRAAMLRVGQPADATLRLRPTRYRAGLRACDATMTGPLLQWLSEYLEALEDQRAHS